MSSTAIIFCCEKGFLEPQTKLLIRTLRKFGNLPDTVQLYCFSPRKYFRPGPSTIKFLEQNNIEYIDKNLNKDYPYFPLANKPIVCSFIEKTGLHDRIVFLDSDCIILGDFLQEIPQGDNIYLQSIFNKNLGCEGEDDSNYKYWKFIFDTLSVTQFSYNHTLKTNQKIIGYWNSGIITTASGLGLLTKWKENFTRLMKSLHWRNEQLFYLEQVALSATLHQQNVVPYPLEKGINYPISHNDVHSKNKISNINELKIGHHFGEIKKMILNLNKLQSDNSEKVDFLMSTINELKLLKSGLYMDLIKKRNTNLQKALYFAKKYHFLK